MNQEKLLEVKGLKTRFKIGEQWATAVNGIDFDIFKGETLGIVGESGSGKSVSVLSLMQLVPNPPGEVSEGTIKFKDVLLFDGKDLERIKQIPEHQYFKSLKGNLRSWAARAFFIGWIVLHILLPLSGVFPFLVSFLANIIITSHLFFSSPQKDAYTDFRDRLYQKMGKYRGREIAMIFQEPMTSLNPVFTIGLQVMESIKPKTLFQYFKDGILSVASTINEVPVGLRVRLSLTMGTVLVLFSQLVFGWSFFWKDVALFFMIGTIVPSLVAYLILGLRELVSEEYKGDYETLFLKGADLLRRVGIPDPEKRMHEYPHQFSGGMRQRVMIAMALAKNPSLLIADEPTTALDVTIQAQILDLMLELKDQNQDAAVVLITHDMAVVAETCDRVIVMYGGMIQEVAHVESLFENSLHPYTKGLLNSIPHPDENNPAERLETISGMVPNILDMPVGCKFCTRCDLVEDRCHTEEPELLEMSEGHFVRCHVVEDGETV
ncbi:MAG TPA: ATP-binding cassette domain-containing protein [Candidatus Marinimicrobia bacterium]|jgi:oligopeptide/dipeptide ABC transporter ATP-binding protein|nr:ATP-binding cassette domain-containing protein [Candidatus Neomarinimicrobiota bacterium]